MAKRVTQKAVAAVALASLLASAVASPMSLQKRGFPANGPAFTASALGDIFDNDFPGIQRDGGGSGAVNGFKGIFFSDSYGDDKQGGSYFISNTLTYYGLNDPNDPLNQHDFGDTNTGVPNQPLQNSDGDRADQVGDRVAIWPTSNMTPINGTHMTGFASLVTNVVSGGGGQYLGITQYTVEPTSYGPVATRIEDRAFGASEIGYGGFGSFLGVDGYLYLFAGDGHNAGKGLKVARQPVGSGAVDKTQLKYWDGSNWADSPPANDDTNSNLFQYSGFFSGPYTGDVFYDSYHQSIACVFMESGGGAFQLVYPTGSDITGPWSAPVQLAQYDATTDGLTYAGHAHPEWNDLANGQLLMSYNDGGALRKFVQVQFTS